MARKGGDKLRKNLWSLFFVLALLFAVTMPVFAAGYSAQPVMGVNKLPRGVKGMIYSDVYVPSSTSLDGKTGLDKESLNKGTSVSYNIFGLVEIGDAGINAAAKNGSISKIYYVDIEPLKVYAYYFYFTGIKTIVYGE